MKNEVQVITSLTQKKTSPAAVDSNALCFFGGHESPGWAHALPTNQFAFANHSWLNPSGFTAGTSNFIASSAVNSNAVGVNWVASQPNLYFFLGEETNQTVTLPISRENELNSARRKEFLEKYCPRLKALIRDEPFEAGVLSRADNLLREILDTNASVAKESLEELFLTSLRTSDFETACGVVELVGRLEEIEINPQGTTMAVAALAVQNTRLQEAAVRAFENWGSESGAAVLEKIEFKSGWVKDYAIRVISAIRAK